MFSARLHQSGVWYLIITNIYSGYSYRKFHGDTHVMENDREFSFTADIKDRPLEGGMCYMLRLPASIPECNFWSVILYDCQTSLMIHTVQTWPSVFSSQKGLIVNRDGSVDIWFGPKERKCEGCNYINTIPGKNWYIVIRLYDLAEPVNNEWKPEEITEVVNDSE